MKEFELLLIWNSPSLFLLIKLPTRIILASNPSLIALKISSSALYFEYAYLLDKSCPKYNWFSLIKNLLPNLWLIFSPATDIVDTWTSLAFLFLATLIKFLTPSILTSSILSSLEKCLTTAAEFIIVSKS